MNWLPSILFGSILVWYYLVMPAIDALFDFLIRRWHRRQRKYPGVIFKEPTNKRKR